MFTIIGHRVGHQSLDESSAQKSTASLHEIAFRVYFVFFLNRKPHDHVLYTWSTFKIKHAKYMSEMEQMFRNLSSKPSCYKHEYIYIYIKYKFISQKTYAIYNFISNNFIRMYISNINPYLFETLGGK